MRDFPESDWKLFRELRVDALDRYCDRVLTEVAKLIADKYQSAHQKYLAMWKLMKERDEDLAVAFNDARRSVAMQQLVMIRRLGLLTDEEFGRFSAETREKVNQWLKIRNER